MASPTVAPDSADAPSPALSSYTIRKIKQGIKTGLAGLIAYAIYAHFHLREGYWAVFSALIVTQANLGASWQSALYRTIGTACGAVSAALLAGLIGNGPIRTGILLFCLASLFGYLATRHAAFNVAGFTVALVLFFSHQQQPWELAWYRVLYTAMGAVIAFAVGVLVWPVRARSRLRRRIALLLQDSGRLTTLITRGVLRGEVPSAELDDLERVILQRRRDITQGLAEARNEPARSRFDYDAYSSFVDEIDHIRQRLLAMSGDSELYVGAGIQVQLVPHLEELCQQISAGLLALGAVVEHPNERLDLGQVVATMQSVDSDLTAIREARKTAPLTLDRMLPFWSFVFNLKEMTSGLRRLEAMLPALE